MVRVTDDDYCATAAHAHKAGLSLSAYLRQVAVNGHVVVSVRQESSSDFAVADQLRRIGININQQMAIAHTRGAIPVELQRLWAKLELILDRIIQREE